MNVNKEGAQQGAGAGAGAQRKRGDDDEDDDEDHDDEDDGSERKQNGKKPAHKGRFDVSNEDGMIEISKAVQLHVGGKRKESHDKIWGETKVVKKMGKQEAGAAAKKVLRGDMSRFD